mmetsp:Transcript_16162/g.34704  ORF Transcript_16162/g.34704 Transcript_16162/m.34704 type:complete len:509 (-) Transcript_16162:277-1803(-)
MFSGRDALEAMGCCFRPGASAAVHAEPLDTAAAKLRGVEAGVQVGWLKHEFASKCRRGMTTHEAVTEIIKPATELKRCRYVATLGGKVVGRARAFSSHTWKAPIHDLISAIAHVLPDDAYVWIDIFAVLQWPVEEQLEDLDFKTVVQACGALLLVATHVPEVAELTIAEAQAEGRVPEAARQLCAFFRVWCLVEIAAALEAKLPVVMLVGRSEWVADKRNNSPDRQVAESHAAQKGPADNSLAPATRTCALPSSSPAEQLQFAPNTGMLNRLYWLIDITKAAASVEADRVRILEEVRSGVGIEAVNSLARGAAAGAETYMGERELLAAVLGDTAPLQALKGEPRSRALRCAAAGGLMRPLEVLLANGAADIDLELKDEAYGAHALMWAAWGGHTAAIAALLAAGAQVDAPRAGRAAGMTSLGCATVGGHLAATKMLLDAKADVNAKSDAGLTPITGAASGGHLEVLKLLIAAGAEVNVKPDDGLTPLMKAERGGHAEAAQLLRQHGAT